MPDSPYENSPAFSPEQVLSSDVATEHSEATVGTEPALEPVGQSAGVESVAVNMISEGDSDTSPSENTVQAEQDYTNSTESEVQQMVSLAREGHVAEQALETLARKLAGKSGDA